MYKCFKAISNARNNNNEMSQWSSGSRLVVFEVVKLTNYYYCKQSNIICRRDKTKIICQTPGASGSAESKN